MKESVYKSYDQRAILSATTEERGLIVTEPTTVTTNGGQTRNGNLRFTICPIQAALQQDFDRQMHKLDEDAARQKYAGLMENTG